MCMNNLCEYKDNCLRHTAKPDTENQSWGYFNCKGDEYCFFPNNKFMKAIKEEK